MGVQQPRGVSVALMGIDGAGKTSLAGHLRRAFEGVGIECVEVGRKPAVRAAGAAFPGPSLERLWLESWRLLFGGGHADGRPVDAAVPGQFTRMSSDEIVYQLPERVTGVRRSGPLASLWTEYTIDQLVRAEAVEPVLARGAVALSDGFGFKGAAKVLGIARRLVDDTVTDAVLDRTAALVRMAYSDPFLQPDLGFLLDADPERSYGWRLSQSGRMGPAEDLWLAGRSGVESFVELQRSVAADLRSAATEWGWTVLPVDGRPQDETATEAVRIALAHPHVQRCANSRLDLAEEGL
jgi:hypothetical protein